MTERTHKRYRIVKPFRFFLFVLICVMILTMGIYTVFSNPIEAAATSYTYREITVRENDTLWDIACEYGPSNMDPRIVVQEICDANDITPEDIHCGDSVFVPIEINR
ncbi:MAG: LysM peptidoglycan-binding domain-containing protein [Mogibacterium sp.]|nr:LysM peptidoglycan-binding domain-containing protein [Mogibacterium sp.]